MGLATANQVEPPASRRLALVICNGGFQHVPRYQLQGPAKAATLLQAVLSDPESLVDSGMFNLFAARSSSDVRIAKSAKHLLEFMGQAISSRQAAIDAQGDEHHEIDLRLVARIEQVLEPLIGPSEGNGAVWFQSMDWYGDGIRHLEFQPAYFPLHSIPKLQSLLQHEYSPFGILCWTPFAPDVPVEQAQGLVIFSDTLVVTARVAGQMAAKPAARHLFK